MTIFGTARAEYRFFWWWDLASFGSVEEARKAVNFHRQNPRVFPRFRGLLWASGGLTKPEAEVAEEIALLLSKGKLITEWRPFYPYWRREDEFGERDYGRQFLSEFQRNANYLDGFRTRFCKRNADASLHNFTDSEVIRGVAELLRSGELLVGYYGPPSVGFAIKESTAPRWDDSAESSPRRTAGSAVEAPEEPTFVDHDGAQQAAALKEAAEEGAPFCEVCNRK